PENDPFMQKELIFARDLGKANTRLLQHYPSLPAYRLEGDSLVVFSPSGREVSLSGKKNAESQRTHPPEPARERRPPERPFELSHCSVGRGQATNQDFTEFGRAENRRAENE
ncbi:MAG: hypothetical protein WEB33_01220, partial [Bacteroidota bacterium]